MTHRTLVEEPSYETSRRLLSADVRRLDEALHGITWVLCHEPERGKATDVDEIAAMPSEAFFDVPSLVVYYSYDEQSVRLIAVVAAMPDDQECGPDANEW
jgi:hypothetical protein